MKKKMFIVIMSLLVSLTGCGSSKTTSSSSKEKINTAAKSITSPVYNICVGLSRTVSVKIPYNTDITLANCTVTR